MSQHHKHTCMYHVLSTLCIQEPPKQVLLQSVKTLMKCNIMLHFIRVYTVCKGKKIFRQKNTILFVNYNLTPLNIYNVLSQVYCIKPRYVQWTIPSLLYQTKICTMNYPKFIVSNQEEESISIQRVNNRLNERNLLNTQHTHLNLTDIQIITILCSIS